jgi:hypothetical protein
MRIRVRDLLEALSDVDPDAFVVMENDEMSGAHEINDVILSNVYLDCNPNYGSPHLTEAQAIRIRSMMNCEDDFIKRQVQQLNLEPFKAAKPHVCVVIS